MPTWLQRHATIIVGFGATGMIIGIGWTAAMEPSWTGALIAARQMYGLTALGFLLAASVIGPLTAVLPRLPLRGFLIAARRSVGVSTLVLVIPHLLCYLGPVLLRNWRELYQPGLLWVFGLVLGSLALFDLSMLAWTSRDAAVMALGGRRWKRLHRTVYIAVPAVLLHALFVGTDFGIAQPTANDGKTVEADYGSLIAFSVLTGMWLLLVWLRSRGIRWPARTVDPAHRASPNPP